MTGEGVKISKNLLHKLYWQPLTAGLIALYINATQLLLTI